MKTVGHRPILMKVRPSASQPRFRQRPAPVVVASVDLSNVGHFRRDAHPSRRRGSCPRLPCDSTHGVGTGADADHDLALVLGGLFSGLFPPLRLASRAAVPGNRCPSQMRCARSIADARLLPAT